MTKDTNDEWMRLSPEIVEWRSSRRQAGRLIDPETAEVTWLYAPATDPYGVYSDRPRDWDEGQQYFARAPGSDIWVSFYDLPKATSETLRKRIDSGELKDSRESDLPF